MCCHGLQVVVGCGAATAGGAPSGAGRAHQPRRAVAPPSPYVLGARWQRTRTTLAVCPHLGGNCVCACVSVLCKRRRCVGVNVLVQGVVLTRISTRAGFRVGLVVCSHDRGGRLGLAPHPPSSGVEGRPANIGTEAGGGPCGAWRAAAWCGDGGKSWYLQRAVRRSFASALCAVSSLK